MTLFENFSVSTYYATVLFTRWPREIQGAKKSIYITKGSMSGFDSIFIVLVFFTFLKAFYLR